LRVLVCGGRKFSDYEQMDEILDRVNPSVLIQGGATGADSLAHDWAKRRLSEDNRITEKADWNKYGKSAGFLRNQKMIDDHHPDLVIAFDGGNGTAHMIRTAKKAKIRLLIVRPKTLLNI